MLRRPGTTVLLAACLAACGPSPTPRPTTTEVVPSVQPSNPPSTQPPPSPSLIPLMSEDELADVSVDAERPTAICDQDPSDARVDGPKSLIDCSGGLQYGFRALRTRLGSIDRLYLHRGSCAAVPCTPEELDVVSVIGWHGSDAYSVVITADPEGVTVSTITAPIAGALAAWPKASSSVPPRVARPSIPGAPHELRRRAPYPYCGREKPVGVAADQPGDYELGLEINRCFIDGVLEGRPVEMIVITAVTRQPVVLRFDGSGFVTQYMQIEGTASMPPGWYRREGCITLERFVYFGFACASNPKKVG